MKRIYSNVLLLLLIEEDQGVQLLGEVSEDLLLLRVAKDSWEA